MRTTATRLRPMLRPGLAVLWRDATTIQIGIDERIAVTIDGADEAVRCALSLLDGARTFARAQADAGAYGLPAGRFGELLALLEGADVLTWSSLPDRRHGRLDPRPVSDDVDDGRLAPDEAAHAVAAIAHRRAGPGPSRTVRASTSQDELAMRAAAWIDVVGAGRVGGAVAELLAAAGIGRVTVTDGRAVSTGDLAPLGPGRGDLGVPRERVHRDRIHALAPATRTAPDQGAMPTITVLAHDAGPDAFLADTWSRSGQVHVAAYVREHVGHVGPLVVPGRSTCLHCIDLHRADRDPGWAQIATQLGSLGVATPACDVALAMLVAAQTTLEVLAYIDGIAATAGPLGEPAVLASRGAVLQTTLPGATTVRRRWPPHPRCHCGAATAYDGVHAGFGDVESRADGQQLLPI